MSFKDDLGEALQKAVSYYNEGSSPSEAVVKSAMDMGFNLDQTDRLVEKFNTARTIHHFEAHPDDRTASFDLASKEKVAHILSDGGVVKKASVESSAPAWHDYTGYDQPDEDMFADHPDGEVVKQAESMDAHDLSGFSLDGLGRMIVLRADEHMEMAKQAEDTAGMMMSEVIDGLSKIASAVLTGYDPEERYARFRVACSSYPAFASFDGLVPDHVKKAADGLSGAFSRLNIVDLGDMSGLPERLEYLGSLADRAESLRKQAGFQRRARSEVLDRMARVNRFGKYAAANMPGGTRGSGSVPGSASGSGSSSGPGSGSGQGSGSGGKGKGGDRGSRRKSVIEFLGIGSETVPKAREAVTLGMDSKDVVDALKPKKPSGPSLKDHIDNLRRSDILNDLYANDPIISEADPNDVVEAYKTIVQSSPEVSMNKEVVRAILRQSVNSIAVSPFDVKQWADLENVMLKNRAYSRGKYDPRL